MNRDFYYVFVIFDNHYYVINYIAWQAGWSLLRQHDHSWLVWFSVTFGQASFSSSAKRMTQWSIFYFTHSISYYPVPSTQIHLQDFPRMMQQNLPVISSADQDLMSNFCKRNKFSFFAWSVKCLFNFSELWKDRFIFSETWSRPPPPFTSLILKKFLANFFLKFEFPNLGCSLSVSVVYTLVFYISIECHLQHFDHRSWIIT